MTISIPAGRTIALEAKSGGGYQAVGLAVSGNFTPLVANDFSSGTIGSQDPDWLRSEYQTSVVKSGSQALSVRTNPAEPDGACGGSPLYAGRQSLPVDIPVGKTIWQRFYMYFPSSFSFGYSYNKWNLLLADGAYSAGATTLSFIKDRTIRSEEVGERVAIRLDSGQWHFTRAAAGSDSVTTTLVIEDPLPSSVASGNEIKTGSLAEAQFCGGAVIDGSSGGGLKFLVFSPNSGTARIYLQPLTPHKDVTGGGELNRILLEYGAQSAGSVGQQAVIPRDRWFSIQMATKVATTTNDGFVRAWLDDELIIEATGINTISPTATGIAQWGLGDYWNGMPYTDGQPGRDTFYIDEVIVATDMDGYGAPTSTDANGNPYIASSVLAGNL